MSEAARESGGLPDLLQRCVEEEVLTLEEALEVDAFRRRSGVGLSRALREMGFIGSIDPALGREAPCEAGVTYQPSLLTTPLNPELTFESLIPCRANSFPLEIAKIVAKHGGSRPAYSPFYVYSDIGLGKTHLLSAIASACDRTALLVNTADLEVELEKATRLQCRAELRQFLSAPELLLVDDVQLCEGHEDLQRELFSVFNLLNRAGRAVVISSDVPPTRLTGVEERLISRLRSGAIVGLQMPDRAERREMIQRFCPDHCLSQEVIEYLADQVTESVRRIKAVLRQLLVTSELTGVEIDLDLARAVVPLPGDLGSSGEREVDLSRDKPVSGIAKQGLSRFKEMLACAETEDEQALALQIAVGERIRQMTRERGDAQELGRLRNCLELLREGQLSAAMRELSTA